MCPNVPLLDGNYQTFSCSISAPVNLLGKELMISIIQMFPLVNFLSMMNFKIHFPEDKHVDVDHKM